MSLVLLECTTRTRNPSEDSPTRLAEAENIFSPSVSVSFGVGPLLLIASSTLPLAVIGVSFATLRPSFLVSRVAHRQSAGSTGHPWVSRQSSVGWRRHGE